MTMKERTKALLQEMNRGIYEKETEVALSLLAAVAGESIIILGPPGVAKSMVARRLKAAFKNAKSFEYLMSRFSTPDEIFGPVSIALLKSSDRYERAIDGYLPTADVVFLDEIWKAGPAIQNTLLTVINEKLFRNGFDQMLLDGDDGMEAACDEQWQISNEEYDLWTESIKAIGVADDLLACIHVVRKALGAVAMATSDERHNVYVSDRRWKKIVKLLRTSAFLQDRKQAELADLLPIYHCLWNEPDERDDIRRIVIRSLFAEFGTTLAKMKMAIEADVRLSRMHDAAKKAKAATQQRDGNKKIVDGFYYHLLDHDTGNSYVFIADYQRMRDYSRANAGQLGVLYKDPKDVRRTIIRTYDGADFPDGARQVSLVRDADNLYIDGVQFEIEKLAPGEQQQLPVARGKVSDRNYFAELDELGDKVRKREEEIRGNIFLSKDDRDELTGYLKGFYQEMALTREEIGKLDD